VGVGERVDVDVGKTVGVDDGLGVEGDLWEAVGVVVVSTAPQPLKNMLISSKGTIRKNRRCFTM
jgi:hypothetical protein